MNETLFLIFSGFIIYFLGIATGFGVVHLLIKVCELKDDSNK